MSITDEIKARLDIVNFLSQYIQLKKAGRNYTGLCPFHAEKTPSFVVFPDSQNWRCFGACGEGGDIFNFIMKHDGLDFVSALKLLADKAGVTLQERTPEQAKGDEHLDKLRGLLDETAKFFHEKLINAPGAEHARAYTRKRGLSAQTLDEFRMGFAPDDWHQALDHLKMLGYTEDEILEAGVALRNEDKGRVYDRFRNRLVIPICDVRGQVIGFGARALKPDDNPKYLNSPQTALFDKGATLFGLHLARRTIRESETAVIVEGYMDAIQAHQGGFRNVVAQMGTALTEPQLKQLSKYARRLILALDPDAAGVKATMRGLDVARQTLGESEAVFDPRGAIRQASKLGVELMVITVPQGKDPDDLIRENPAGWQALIDHAQTVVDYVIEVGTAHLTPKSTFGDREQVARDLLPLLAATENDLQQHYNIQRLALKLHLDGKELISWAKRQRVSGWTKRNAPIKAVPTPETQTEHPATQDIKRDPSYVMERYCLAVLMRKPQLWSLANRRLREVANNRSELRIALGPISAGDFTVADFQAILSLLEKALDQDDMEAVDYVEQHLPSELRIEVERLLSEPVSVPTARILPSMYERERVPIMQKVPIRSDIEFLEKILQLRKNRLNQENQQIQYIWADRNSDSRMPFVYQEMINIQAIRYIDLAITEMRTIQRDLS